MDLLEGCGQEVRGGALFAGYCRAAATGKLLQADRLPGTTVKRDATMIAIAPLTATTTSPKSFRTWTLAGCEPAFPGRWNWAGGD